MKLVIIGIFFGAGIFLVSSASANDDGELLGKWCDRAIPNNPISDTLIEIRQVSAGSALMIRTYQSGNQVRHELVRTAPQTFINEGEDGYKILKNKDLELFDDWGTIRFAFVMNPSAQPTDCLR